MLGRPYQLSEADMRAAIEHFRLVEPLCHFDASKGNEGFTAHISFNISSFNSGRDYLEIALRKAVLRFTPREPGKWAWAEAIREWVAGCLEQFSIKESSSRTKTRGANLTGRSEASAQGNVKLPLIGTLGGTARFGAEAGRQTGATRGTAREITRTHQARYAEMHRPASGYELRLTSPPDDDLVRLNSDLDRMGVLASTEPSSTDPADVGVTLTLRSRDALEHSIRVRDATGVWKPLAEPRAKKVLTELLFEKLLVPLHEGQILWPKEPPQ